MDLHSSENLKSLKQENPWKRPLVWDNVQSKTAGQLSNKFATYRLNIRRAPTISCRNDYTACVPSLNLR
jgi:hypothetical protein